MLSVGCVCAPKVGLNKKSIDVIKEIIQGFFFFFFFLKKNFCVGGFVFFFNPKFGFYFFSRKGGN